MMRRLAARRAAGLRAGTSSSTRRSWPRATARGRRPGIVCARPARSSGCRRRSHRRPGCRRAASPPAARPDRCTRWARTACSVRAPAAFAYDRSSEPAGAHRPGTRLRQPRTAARQAVREPRQRPLQVGQAAAAARALLQQRRRLGEACRLRSAGSLRHSGQSVLVRSGDPHCSALFRRSAMPAPPSPRRRRGTRPAPRPTQSSQRELGGDVVGDGGQTEHANLHRLPGPAQLLQLARVKCGAPQHQRPAGDASAPPPPHGSPAGCGSRSG